MDSKTEFHSHHERVKAWLSGDKSGLEKLVLDEHCKVLSALSNEFLVWDERNGPKVNVLFEVAQEAFAVAFSKLETYEGKASFITWVVGIGKNCFLKYVESHNEHMAFNPCKRRLPKKNSDGKEEHDYAPREVHFDEDLFDTAEMLNEDVLDPLKSIVEGEQCANMYSIFKSMPNKYQQIIYLHSILGLPYKEIAEKLKEPENRLSARHLQASKVLRKKFEDFLKSV